MRQAKDLRAREQARLEAYRAATAHYPPVPQWGRDFPDGSRPYDGWPVPEGVLSDPNARFLGGFEDAWNVAPASNGRDVVIFHRDFRAETDRGEVICEEDFRRDEDGSGPGPWLANIIASHNRLDEEGRPHNRIARFRGSTPSSYHLERPPPGIFHFIPPREKHDTVLALHQRWALQYLSACQHIHSKGIILNGTVVQENLWLRDDFSLVIAGFAASSCAELGVKSGYWANSSALESPFQPDSVCSTNEQNGEIEPQERGNLKTDLFNWAYWVYSLMIGRDNPVVDRETLWMWDGPEGYRLREQKFSDEQAAREGMFEKWPILKDEELGISLVKAWRGEYGDAREGLGDARTVLGRRGRVLVEGVEDELRGFEWEREFEYDGVAGQISRVVGEKVLSA